ncbi:ArnT family glycosyltransferase [Rhizobium leguminosarum]|uniref:ArnT family glycosyltransferase n=1 Tax=Rhizobium leguminosarum TaxID=384 RepID=UPI00161E9AF5|nr:glycosyltransferase family 39 protein [Rhizobium leguminosarum]MBB4342157.1 4-amino-4-deoxy-L-arabinose transferase-like glycosyltransferase [Rhizobium leguminosarum]MBB6294781.1 4-amino-4-deoxy-L-arabinose transferase-like glycosyltransferase [Rhizobium leguminosarum]
MFPSRAIGHICLVWLVCTTYAIVNIRWIIQYRLGSVPSLDEAGYLTFAFQYFYAMRDGGFWNWVHAIQGPSIFSPLTAAVASLVFQLFGKHLAAAYMATLAAGIVTLVSTYAIALRIMGKRRALICLLLIASLPAVIDYTRTFEFALPVTAATCVALYCLVRSDHMRSLPWAIAFGFCVGLMPLFRTMTLAFIPGMALGAFVYSLGNPGGYSSTAKRLLWAYFLLLLAATVAIAVAMTWFWENADGVFQYLTNYGYGAKATEFGPSHFWWGTIVAILSALFIIHLPHALFLAAGGAAMIVYLARSCASGRRKTVEAIFQSPVTPIVIFVALASAVLLTSSNKGSAFALPIIPPAIILAVWAIFRPERRRRYKLAAAVYVLIIAALGAIPALDLNNKLAKPTYLHLPQGIDIVVTSGRSSFENFLLFNHIGSPKLPSVIPLDESRRWMQLSVTIFRDLQKVTTPNQLVMFGFRHVILNSNTVTLANLMDTQQKYFISGIDPTSVGETYDDYRRWLTETWVSDTCLMLLSNGNEGEVLPAVNTAELLRAMQDLGYSKSGMTWTMPNGRLIEAWKRSCPQAL